ncbi:hypothetical protein M8R20_08285 [Pseudomonas sp. R2.Fl]|nr:hypothetical protein [Pseudomonas sp. R2.Fl]
MTSLEGSMGVEISFNAAAQALSLLTGVGKATRPAAPVRPVAALKVEQAADNAAYWSIATSMNADNLSLASAQDATGRASAIVDVALVSMHASAGLLGEIRASLVSAKSDKADKPLLAEQLEELKARLVALADGASFDGENWLSLPAGQSSTVESVVASVTRGKGGDLSVNVLDFDTAVSALVSRQFADDGILTRSYMSIQAKGEVADYFLLDTGAAVPTSASARQIALTPSTSADEIDGMIAVLDVMAGQIAEAGSALQTTSERIVQNMDFDAMRDTIEGAVGDFVETDLDAGAAARAAEQSRDQLLSQALNIGNGSAERSFKLFV